jgi:hypothetical protein
VAHFITGNIVAPATLGIKTSKIEVCRGTSVSIAITDSTGVPTNIPKTGLISCNSSGCSATNIQSTLRYNSTSADGKDKDGMTLRPSDG